MSDGHPCLIREVLYAPPAEEEVVALVEVALNFHNSAHYHQAVQTYIQARELWAREERSVLDAVVPCMCVYTCVSLLRVSCESVSMCVYGWRDVLDCTSDC